MRISDWSSYVCSSDLYYPGSAALLNTQARLAAFYARTGQAEPALVLYRQIVDANAESGNSSATLRRTLAPYFALLADDASRPEAVADMFQASQGLVRPGESGRASGRERGWQDVEISVVDGT